MKHNAVQMLKARVDAQKKQAVLEYRARIIAADTGEPDPLTPTTRLHEVGSGARASTWRRRKA